MLEDTTQRTWRYIEVRLSGNRNGAGLSRVLELAMTATRAHVDPTVSLHEPNEIPDLQE